MTTSHPSKVAGRSGWRAALLAAATAALLAACGGGSSPSFSLSGVAATGAAIPGGAVSVICASGTGSATTASDGSFNVTINPTSVGPCLVRVTSGSTVLYGYAPSSGRVNITPVTDMIVGAALGSDPAAAFTSFDANRARTLAASIDGARTRVMDEVTRLLGGTPSGDPLTQPFVVGDADDKLLDNLADVMRRTGKTQADLRTAVQGGNRIASVLPAEETRTHDIIPYAINAADASTTTFAPMAAAKGDTVDMSTTSRWAGVLQGSAYRIEVPANWNGELVMYTHGYAGEGFTLNAVDSLIRRYLIQNGYAWAASSYSKNSYNVRAGIEDTNLLALNFNTIAEARGRTLAKPTRTYIMGVSMGGHIAAAAVEAETYATAVNKVKYDGALPMCGVTGDTVLFDTFGAMQVTAQALAGYADTPVRQWSSIKATVTTALFGTTSLAATTPMSPNGSAGLAYYSVLQNLTGGSRPLFDLGYAYGGSFQAGPYAFFGIDTILTGLTTKASADTNRFTYTVDGNSTVTAVLNASVQKLTADPDFNRLRWDGLRWIPKVNGQPMAPVLSLHTLGDLFVPFSMQQVYRQRTEANGKGNLLVQRAIRGISHCDFTNAEMSAAFADLVKWVKQGTKPAGDDVTTPATVAAPTYGCTFTNDTLDGDDASTTALFRGVIAQAQRTCSAVQAPQAPQVPQAPAAPIGPAI